MALDFSDYDGLQTSIKETLMNRSDLEDQIPGWIQLAEEQHKTDLRIRDMLTRTSTQITARTLALPTGFIKFKRVRIAETSSGYPWPIEIVTPEQLVGFWRSEAQGNLALRMSDGRPANMPRYMSIDGVMEFDLDVSEFDDDEPYLQMLYWKAFTALSDDDDTNALLTRAPGAYFYGALIHSAPYLLDDERIAVWRNEYAKIVSALNLADRDPGGPLASRVAGPTP